MTVLKKLNIIKVKENVPVSDKENTSDTKDSVNNSSSESKMNTSPVINPAIQVKTSTLPTKVEFAEDQKKVDQKKGD